MNKQIKIIGVLIVVVAIFGILNITNQNKESKVVTLGLMLPLSGDYAVAGQNYQKGVELALNQYKKQFPNKTIKLVVEDDGFDVKKGVSAYKKLINYDHIDALMMLSTPVIDAIHEDVVKDGIPVMQLGVQTVGISDDNILQMSPSGETPLREFAQYLEKNHTFSKVAVVYDNTGAGNSFYKAFSEGYSKDFSPFIINTKADIRGHAIKIAAEKYDAVVILTSPENGALFVKEISTLDKTLPFFGFDAQLQTGFADYGRILGGTDKLNGAESLWLKSGNADQFKKLYAEKYNTEPGFISDFGYDILNVLMKNYSNDKTSWLNNIKKENKEGVSGPISFDNNGVRIQPIVINKVIDGKLIQIQ
ncbi:MAG: ABC transporter substrate-binding protein [Candidatus Pacebacteria bacterium]|nr:ABC transporter substrate-binding protein [Candidatus Paceibacterota bacterium]